MTYALGQARQVAKSLTLLQLVVQYPTTFFLYFYDTYLPAHPGGGPGPAPLTCPTRGGH